MHVWLNDLGISWSVHLCMACDMYPTVSNIIDVNIRIVTLFSSPSPSLIFVPFPIPLFLFYHSLFILSLSVLSCFLSLHQCLCIPLTCPPLQPSAISSLHSYWFLIQNRQFNHPLTCVWKNCPHTSFRYLLIVTVCSTSSWKLQGLASLQKWWEKWHRFHNNLRNCLPCLGFF